MMLDQKFENAHFVTLDPHRPRAQALGVINGSIVGFDAEIADLPAAETIDLGGKVVVPGFHDAHLHYLQLGDVLTGVDLSFEKAPTLDAVYELVRQEAHRADGSSWVRGFNLDQNKLGAFPDLAVLDRISNGKPVLLVHVSNHMAVANSEGFARAGVSDPHSYEFGPGGEVVKDVRGRATGLLLEKAKDLVLGVLKPPSSADMLHKLHVVSEHLLARGITSGTVPGVGSIQGIGDSHGDLHWYLLARETGRLRVRSTLMPYFAATHSIEGFAADFPGAHGVDLGLRTGLGDEWLNVGAVKVMLDGSLIGKSAAVSEPFENEPTNRGMMLWTEGEIEEQLIQMHALGWQLALHAIGDRAVERSLRIVRAALQRYPRADHRHRIEHSAITTDRQVGQIAELGILPIPQGGSFVSEHGDGYRTVLGEHRVPMVYRQRSFLDAGVELAASTDAPVTDVDPIACMRAMVARRTLSGALFGVDERISPRAALRAYTHGSAFASHHEHRKGTLSVGKLADMTVLTLNPLTHLDDPGLRVVATVVGGQVMYEAY